MSYLLRLKLKGNDFCMDCTEMSKHCPILEIDGFIETGKQFDLDITLPEDNRDVIYGVVKDCHKEPVKDAVVKLIEVICECGKEMRKPVTHTFTDCEGQFVFGPLCPDKKYELEIWVNRVKHIKICAKSHREGECLKAMCNEKCECFIETNKCEKQDNDKECDNKCEK